MEVLLDCYFNKVFTDMDRGSLIPRYKRRQVVDYFSTVIKGCCQGEQGCDPQTGCKKAVEIALKIHKETRDNNGAVCLLGKYHNILYIAATLCFEWKLEDNATVVTLLNDIYRCERTFERLMVGAIFGTRVSHLISGWKSDFQDRKECLKAIEYFLDHAAKAQLMFDYHGELKTMAEVPMVSYSEASPAKVCVQAGMPDVLAVLLRYGAIPLHHFPNHCALHLLLYRLQTLMDETPEKRFPRELVRCLLLLVESLPQVFHEIYDPLSLEDVPIYIHPAILAELPDDRTGFQPPDLKHLCRCVIRYRLAKKGQLPYGTYKLNLPQTLQSYINLEENV